jgi:hypothetical protein
MEHEAPTFISGGASSPLLNGHDMLRECGELSLLLSQLHLPKEIVGVIMKMVADRHVLLGTWGMLTSEYYRNPTKIDTASDEHWFYFSLSVPYLWTTDRSQIPTTPNLLIHDFMAAVKQRLSDCAQHLPNAYIKSVELSRDIVDYAVTYYVIKDEIVYRYCIKVSTLVGTEPLPSVMDCKKLFDSSCSCLVANPASRLIYLHYAE